MKMVHLAFWLSKLVSMDFTSSICSSMDFLSKKISFLAKHLYDNGPPGIPVIEVVLVLVSPLTKAVSMDPTPMEHTLTKLSSIEFNSIDFKLIQLGSIDFFSNRNDIHWILFNATVSLGNLFHKIFNFFHDFPINRFCSQGLPISGISFFGSHRI